MTENNAPSTPQVSSTPSEQTATPAVSTPAAVSSPATSQPESEMSLGDALRAEFKKAATPEPAKKEPAIAQEKSDANETTEKDPSSIEDPLEEVTDELETQETPSEEKELEDAVEKEFPLVPANFSAKERELFEWGLNSEDPKVQELTASFIDRYNGFKSGFTKKTQEYAHKMKEIDGVFTPIDPLLKANNFTRGSYINNLIGWDKTLTANPADGIKQLMQKYGVTPSHLGIKAQAKQDDFGIDLDEGFTNPQNDGNQKLSQLENENKNLRNQVENLPVQIQIRQFAEARDTEDKLIHPHFEKVRATMATLISKDPTQTLKQAYTKALKIEGMDTPAKPQVNQPDPNEALRKKVQQARKAGRGISTTGGTTTTNAEKSLREDLVDQFKKYS